MTTTPDIQVPGQLELPLEFEKPILKTVTYTETYTEVVKHSVALEVPANYAPLMDQVIAHPSHYQRTLKSLIEESGRYNGVSASHRTTRYVNDSREFSDFSIR